MPYARPATAVSLYYEEAGRGVPGRVRARVLRRPAQLGAAAALFQPPLPLHRVQRARLPALRRAARPLAGTRRPSSPTTSPTCCAHLGLRKAHVVGCSMGGNTTLQFGMRHPRMARSLTAINPAPAPTRIPTSARSSCATSETLARRFEALGMPEAIAITASGRRACSSRTRTRAASREFGERYGELSAPGSPTRCAACRRGGRRSTRSSADCAGCACRCWS